MPCDAIPGAPEARDDHKTKGSVSAPVAFVQLYHSTLYPETRKKVQMQHHPLSPVKFAHPERTYDAFATAPPPQRHVIDSPTHNVGVDTTTTAIWKNGVLMTVSNLPPADPSAPVANVSAHVSLIDSHILCRLIRTSSLEREYIVHLWSSPVEISWSPALASCGQAALHCVHPPRSHL